MWIIILFVGLLIGGYFIGLSISNKKRNKKNIRYNMDGWIKVDNINDIPEGEEVLAYNPEWIDEDFCPTGVRIGFCTDGDNGKTFYSAKWNNEQDSYRTCYEEGDDYDTWQVTNKNKTRTFYHRDGKTIEGYLPNVPTHFMYINAPNINK